MQGEFGVRPAGEGKRSTHLMGIHPPSCAGASLNSRGVGCCVAQLSKHLADPFLTAMGIANFDVDYDVIAKHLWALSEQAGGGFEPGWYARLYQQVAAELRTFA